MRVAVKERKKITRLFPGLLAVVLLLQSCASAEFRTTPVMQLLPETATANNLPRVSRDEVLKVITLNIAHGRGETFHQLLQTGPLGIRKGLRRDNAHLFDRLVREH